MLRARVLVAAILIPLVVGAVYGLPSAWFAVLLGVVIFIAAQEWAGLLGYTGRAATLGYPTCIAVTLGALAPFASNSKLYFGVLALASAWWCVATLWIASCERNPGADLQPVHRGLGALIGAAVLVPLWLGLVGLHAIGPRGAALILCLLVVIWSADSGAYFAGRRWGERRLAPRVSPGKTWAGVYGGLGAAALTAIVAGQLGLSLEAKHLIGFVILCLVSVSFSITGDLLESLFKRTAGVKDSGTLLPGHGGVLDRIDSLTAAAPIFALGAAGLGLRA